ncbi:head decoration protein [Mesorhizobium sp. M0088]|uniref:head decoration protein n=1 Tax=Mesorhizobium sp. M0088 TaxID=2956873 RepID=UPI00333ABE76
MTTLTEARHAGGYLLSEANGTLSREKRTAGGTLRAGEVVKLSGDDLVSYDGSGTVVGIAFQAAVTGDEIAYHARLAEVVGEALFSTEQTDGTIDTGGIAGLLDLNIVVR